MTNIIKKISVLGICINIALNLNNIANAGVIDIITNDAEKIETQLNQGIFSDVQGHWAEEWINKAVKLGFVSGYNDGTFRPDRTVTRAEFAKLLNSAMITEDSVHINFSDVFENEWFYSEVQKSVAVGFFSGYDNNTFKPNNPIKREEVAKVVSNTITTGDLDGEGATLLNDYNTIQDWAKSSVNIAYNKGYILGYPEGLYKPSKALTRAEAVKIIYEIIENENIERGFNLTNYNESYYGTVVVGDLNVLESVGSGNVYIRNVTVLGDIKILADDINSVVLTDVKARNIIVEDKNNAVKIICNDNIYIDTIQMPAIVQRVGNNINIKAIA